MLRLIRNLILILALAVGVAFGYVNRGFIGIDLLWAHARMPLSALLGIAFVVGFAIALLVCSLRILRLRARLSRSRRQLKQTRTETSDQRSLPAARDTNLQK
jgi:uncharacterized membrane protein YciS (DUF1049 family)